jgi:diguanylate cyclase (GGDEF)-like protein
MRVMEWWSKYTARRETGGAQQAFEGDAGEGMAPPSHESFNRERQLNVLSLLLHSAGTVEEMLAVLAEKGPQVADAEVVYPLLLDKRRDLLHAKPLQGNSIAALDSLSAALETEVADLEFPLPAQSVRRKALESGEVEVLSSLRELAEDVVGKAACEAAQRALGPKRVVLAPMLMDGDPLGLLVFLVKEEQFDQELLEVLTGHATLAVKNLTDLEQLGQFGDVDQVTWLHNRRYFMESLEREIVRAKRYRRPLSMIFLDIDRFSSFRESYGPSLGDRLLRSIGMLLAESSTEPEVVARFGDDEFALLLPEVNRAAAVSITTNLMTRISQVTVFGGGSGSPEPVSATAAIVCYPEDGATPYDLLSTADSGLEEARREKSPAELEPEPVQTTFRPARRAS